MLMKRIISTFLVILMLASALSVVIMAEGEGEETTAPVYEYNTSNSERTMNYMTGAQPYVQAGKEDDTTTIITTQKEKLEIMDLRFDNGQYRMYVDAFSGEVAVENVATKEVLFTNPYNVGARGTTSPNMKNENGTVSADLALSEDVQKKLLSQIHIRFTDTSNSNLVQDFYSFEHASMGGDMSASNENPVSQIVVKSIKNGLRLEYSIGRIDARYLVPERIKADKFEKEILELITRPEDEGGATTFEKLKINSHYTKIDIDEQLKAFEGTELYDEKKTALLRQYPEAEKQPVYVLSDDTGRNDYRALEKTIKKCCPDFSFEDMDEAHLELNFTPDSQNAPLFKVALEYTIGEDGLSVRLPASGIRFNESIYRIEFIEILPYMGAASNTSEGYAFFPDGSGALFDFQELAKRTNVSSFYGDVYGEDFAYFNVGSGRPHNQIVRYPVYGLTETVVDWDGEEKERGFLAIVEEGESLMTLSYSNENKHNSLIMRVNPRPYDSYKINSAISISDNAEWTVVSDRKYTGSIQIKYVMLTDPDIATGEGYYDPSYVGMAKAYREYLIKNGTLTKLTEADVKESLPLYIETFGATIANERFLSVPYDTMKPLTSFGDIKKMYSELSGEGVTNINFILTGYTDGGLNMDSVPYKLKWEKAVKKDLKFEELIADAKENGYGIYPDFDFAFASSNTLFDGLTLKKHAVMTIDGRYSSKREYSATRQAYVSYFELAISPAYFSRFYERLTEDYLEYDPIGISVSSLGSYLNSDFDEDEPYNREDGKGFTIDAFKYLDEKYNKVMTSGGNAYTWKYVDYITDISTDSSRHVASSATVPFLGIVLHGYVQTAGTPVNMEGDIDYAILRAIENGTALKFILSYRNTEELKEWTDTNMYYSVRYDIWFEDLVERYNKINDAIGGLQLSTIEHHEFLDGVRVPDADEIKNDSASDLSAAITAEIKQAAAQKEAVRKELQGFRKNVYDFNTFVKTYNTADKTQAKASKEEYDALFAPKVSAQAEVEGGEGEEGEAPVVITGYNAEAFAKRIALINGENGTKAAMVAAADTYRNAPTAANRLLYEDAKKAYDTSVAALVTMYNDYNNKIYTEIAVKKIKNYADMYLLAKKYLELDDSALTNYYDAAEIAAIKAIYNSIKVFGEEFVTYATEMDADRAAIIEVITNAGYADKVGLVVEENENATFDKYAADDNSIAYEIYDNGTAFILNFNNYAVKVELDGTYYTVDAYGYVIIK